MKRFLLGGEFVGDQGQFVEEWLPPTAYAVSQITDDARTSPVFRPFEDTTLHTTNLVESISRAMHSQLLADAIPAESLPVGSSVVPRWTLKELRYSVKEDLAGGSVAYCDPLGQDEYMVIRSRVVLDENGKVIRANYSQIQGPFNIGSSIEFKDSYFNPTVNDTNLEYEQNLRYSNARR